MKTKTTLYTAIVLIIFSVGCDYNLNSNQPAGPIDSIKIINRTARRFKKNDTTIKDVSNLTWIDDQLRHMTETSQANLKANNGFYEMIVFYKNGKKEDLGIVYTVYDGIIIDNYTKEKEFKNDTLEQRMWNFFK